jgi:hypothetical protein
VETVTCDGVAGQGPEGRWLNVSPARKGWVFRKDDKRRKCGTLQRCYPNLDNSADTYTTQRAARLVVGMATARGHGVAITIAAFR